MEALACCERARYGLVFTDICLPGADGYELVRDLRALEHAADGARDSTELERLAAELRETAAR